MAELINEGSGERTHVQSRLMRESLMDREVLAASDAQQVIPISASERVRPELQGV